MNYILHKITALEGLLNQKIHTIKPQDTYDEHCIKPLKRLYNAYDFGVAIDFILLKITNFDILQKHCHSLGLRVSYHDFYYHIESMQFLPNGDTDYLVYRYGCPERFKNCLQNQLLYTCDIEKIL